MRSRALLEATLLFGLLALLLALLLHHWQAPLLDALMPAYRRILHALLPGFQLDHLDWRIDRGETQVALNVTLAEYRVIAGKLIAPGIEVHASTLAASAWAYPALMFALAAVWPQRVAWQRLSALLCSVPFAGLLLLLDTPLMLWSSVDDFLLWAADPAYADVSPGVAVQRFLAGGGRYALAMTMSLVALRLHAASLRMMAQRAAGITPDRAERGPHFQ